MKNKSWKLLKLENFVSLQRGYDLPESKRKLGNIPVIGSFGITGYHNIAKVKAPGVTIGRSGASIGVVTYSSVDFWPHNATLFVTSFHDNDEKFVEGINNKLKLIKRNGFGFRNFCNFEIRALLSWHYNINLAR